MTCPNGKQEPPTPTQGDINIPSRSALDNAAQPTPRQPSRTVSSTPQVHQQHTPRQSVDLQHFPNIIASCDLIAETPDQRSSSPFVRSANASPVPPARAVSPQIATKFIKASEMARPAPSGSPLRKGYVVIHKDNQENAPPSPELGKQKTLYRPKSKLRLRLKLTPPHPAGVKVESTPTKPSLKVRLLSSSNRNNEQPVRKPSHQQQTSISTIRAYSPAAKAYPETPSNLSNNFINYFPTHFNSGSPQSYNGQNLVDERERGERERRTAEWYPPAKAIPRSRRAWNLRVDGRKAENGMVLSDGRFESDFDGQVSGENEGQKSEPGIMNGMF